MFEGLRQVRYLGGARVTARDWLEGLMTERQDLSTLDARRTCVYIGRDS
jgi:hypothetical protein